MKRNKIETVMTKEYWEQNYKRDYRRNYKRRLRRKFVNFCKGIIFGALALGIIGCAGASDFEDTGYRLENGTFYWTDEEGQFVITEDGHIYDVVDWSFDNGDKIRVTFYGNYTEDVEDDVVTDIETRWF